MTSRVPSDVLARLERSIEARLPAYLAELEALVAIDSGTFSKAGVDAVADRVAARLEDLGGRVVRHPHAELGDTLVADFEARAGAPTVVLIGHMDTVFEDGTAGARPYSTADGRAYGPGVGDMKSGLLLGLAAVEAVRELEAEAGGPSARLLFIANSDEEIGSPSSTPIIRAASEGATASLVLEGARPNGDVVSARKGLIHARLRLHGRAAHAGVEPERGRSATLAAAHKTIALHELNGRWPEVTVNVGVLRGGTRPNIVADEAELQVDIRAFDGALLGAAEAELRRIADEASVPDVTTELDFSMHWAPMAKLPGSRVLIDEAVAIAGQLGFALGDSATGGGSDANTTAAMGIPTIDGLGPVGGGAHALDEYIELDSIVPRTVLVAALIVSVGRGPDGAG